MNNPIDVLCQMIDDSSNIVFFGGAGVSTESGIPDFRSVDGLYAQQFAHPPEVMLSHSFFRSHPAEFYHFYRSKLLTDGIKPNQAHIALAKLEAAGKLKAVITQNIDGLHQAAGSQNVLEIHGTTHENFCMQCKQPYGIEVIKAAAEIPTCDCGGMIKPNVVLYEESLNMRLMRRAEQYISEADMLIIGGTSLAVYPAAGLVYHYRGDKLVMINNAETSFDERVDLIIRDRIGKVLGRVV